MKKNNRGFSFIELLITLTVMGISFLPLMNMFSVALVQVNTTGELTTARYLAQEEMERTKNLNFTIAQFKEQGNMWNPPLEEPAMEINRNYFRVLRKIIPQSDPLEVHIQVFKDEGIKERNQLKPMVELVTLFEDFEWDFVL